MWLLRVTHADIQEETLLKRELGLMIRIWYLCDLPLLGECVCRPSPLRLVPEMRWSSKRLYLSHEGSCRCTWRGLFPVMKSSSSVGSWICWISWPQLLGSNLWGLELQTSCYYLWWSRYWRSLRWSSLMYCSLLKRHRWEYTLFFLTTWANDSRRWRRTRSYIECKNI